jgi:hypothetical protein
MVSTATVAAQSAITPAVDRAAWLRAWERAKAEKLIPFRSHPAFWIVKTYVVSVTGPRWFDLACTCKAGNRGLCFKHKAVVAKAVAAHVLPVRGTEKGKGAPQAPASPAIVSLSIPSPLDALYA